DLLRGPAVYRAALLLATVVVPSLWSQTPDASSKKDSAQPPKPGVSADSLRSLTGVVHYAGGSGVSGAIVIAVPDLAKSPIRFDTTDMRGAFRLDSLRPGTYKLRVDFSANQTTIRPVKIDAKSVGAIEVTVDPSKAADGNKEAWLTAGFLLVFLITVLAT